MTRFDATTASTTSGTLFYQLGTSGAERVLAPKVDVAPTLVRERASGDRIALSGVGRWLADAGQHAEDASAARGLAVTPAGIEAEVRRAFVVEAGVDPTSLLPYGPAGAGDRRQRSPYAGSADAALRDFASSRSAKAERAGAGAAVAWAEPDGGFSVQRGADLARVSGAAVQLLRLYGNAAGAALAA